MNTPLVIRTAIEEDAKNVHEWLKMEFELGIDGCFFCNWNIIERAARDGELMVGIDPSTNIAVALLVWGHHDISILEVHHQWRRKGIGHQMVDALLAQAKRDDWLGIKVHCCPEDSLDFWVKMGFQKIQERPGDDRIQAVFLLPRVRDDINSNCRVEVKIEPPEYPYSYDDEQIIGPMDFVINAESTPDRVLLGKDFLAYAPSPNTRIKILVDGQKIFYDKVQREEFEDVGGERNQPWVRVRSLWPDFFPSTTP